MKLCLIVALVSTIVSSVLSQRGDMGYIDEEEIIDVPDDGPWRGDVPSWETGSGPIVGAAVFGIPDEQYHFGGSVPYFVGNQFDKTHHGKPCKVLKGYGSKSNFQHVYQSHDFGGAYNTMPYPTSGAISSYPSPIHTFPEYNSNYPGVNNYYPQVQNNYPEVNGNYPEASNIGNQMYSSSATYQNSALYNTYPSNPSPTVSSPGNTMTFPSDGLYQPNYNVQNVLTSGQQISSQPIFSNNGLNSPNALPYQDHENSYQ